MWRSQQKYIGMWRDISCHYLLPSTASWHALYSAFFCYICTLSPTLWWLGMCRYATFVSWLPVAFSENVMIYNLSVWHPGSPLKQGSIRSWVLRWINSSNGFWFHMKWEKSAKINMDMPFENDPIKTLTSHIRADIEIYFVWINGQNDSSILIKLHRVCFDLGVLIRTGIVGLPQKQN